MATPITTTGPSGLSLLQMIWKCIDWTDPENPLLKTSGSGGGGGGGDVAVTSIAPGDNNIGNVDVVSLPVLPAGTNMIGYTRGAPITGGGATTISLTTTSGQKFDADATRDYLEFHNRSAIDCYINHGAAADSNSVLLAAGARRAYYDGMARRAWHAIAASGTPTIHCNVGTV